MTSLDDIKRISRPADVPDYGLLNDLLWSDPSDSAVDWEDNERGVSFCFGKKVINRFLSHYDMDLICRAHMVVEDGYEFFAKRHLVTLFSAPNYCGEFDNAGAMMSVDETLLCSFQVCCHPLRLGASTHISHLLDPQGCGEEGQVPIRRCEHGTTSHTATQAEEEGRQQDGLMD